MNGHLPRGNPVQKHSAGDIYPYVIMAHEFDGDSAGRIWSIIGRSIWFPTCKEAYDYALWLKHDKGLA